MAVAHAVVAREIGGRLGAGDDVVGRHGVVGVRQGHVAQFVPAAFEGLRRLAQRAGQAAAECLPILGGQADAQASAFAALGRRHGHARGIARVVAFHEAQQQAQIGGAARHRAALVEAGRERHHAVAGDAPVGRLEAADAAERGRLADRAAGVRSGRRRHEAGGDGRRGAARGSARHAAWSPGIGDGAEPARFIGGTHCKLVHVGLAQHHRASGLEALHHGCVVGRDELAKHPRTACGSHAFGAEDVLVRERHAAQIAEAFGGNGRVRLAGGRQRLFLAHRDEAVAVVGANAPQTFPGEFLGADRLAAQRLNGSADGRQWFAAVVHSTTRGTR